MALHMAGMLLFALPLIVDARGADGSHGGHASGSHSQSGAAHHSTKAVGRGDLE
jgi:hypothetical protein